MDVQQPCIKTILKRRIVPLTIDIKSKSEHISFEQKLPFNTSKVVGVLTSVSSFSKPEIPICEDTEGYYWEDEDCEID